MTDADRLEATLDRLHTCILAAEFNDLPKILEEIERLAARLPPLTDQSVGHRLRNKASRNGLCLQAAARGIRAAQRRLEDMTNAGARLAVYTSRGQRADVSLIPGILAKRL